VGTGSKINLVGLCATGIVAVVFPLLGLRSYYMHIAIVVQIYILLGLGLNLITGYAGQLSLGHAAFYAIGAYTSALLSTRLGWSFWLCAPVAAIAAAVAGMALGLPTLRLKGPYLVISTLGFGELVRLTLLNWVSLTNGPNGVRNIPAPSPLRLPGGWAVEFTGKTSYYYLLLVVLAIVLFFYYQIVHSRTGRALMAIREDQIAAEVSGINLAFHKVFAFTMGAAMAGRAGSHARIVASSSAKVRTLCTSARSMPMSATRSSPPACAAGKR